jgi:putative DNA primase/helicase
LTYLTSTQKLPIALEFASKGFRVFPQTQGKKGYFEKFQELASTDETQIRDWARIHQGCNWAAMMGPLIVVDIDIKNGGKGEESLKKATEDTTPETFTVRTGSGGRHLYFKAPQGKEVGNIQFKIIGYPDLEVKGLRGWVTLPGSTYTDGREYVITKNIEPAECPEWLLTIIGLYQNRKPSEERKETVEVETIPQGGRNDYMIRMAGGLRRRGFDEVHIFSALEIENRKCDPPLPESELRTIAHSAAGYAVPKYSLDDFGDSERIIDYLEDNYRWCQIHNTWYYYACGVWQRDDQELKVQKEVKKAVDQFLEDATSKQDKFEKAHFFAIRKNFTRIKRLMDCMKSDVTVMVDMFDANHNLLNCRNGVYDLDNLRFMPHVKEHYHSKQVNADYDPTAETPKIFLDFLNEILQGNQELIRYIQKILGYALTGGTGEQEFYIMWGGGNNGKSQLIKAFYLLNDSYCHQMSADKLMMQKYSNNDTYLCQLKKIRSLFCSESDNVKTLDANLIKLLSGGEPLTVAQKYERPETFEISAKVFLITNNQPTIRDTTEGMWRRIRLIPFTYEVPIEKRVKDFGIKLYNAGPSGLLNWFIEGYKLYRIEGLTPPKCVIDESMAYRNEEDIVLQFLTEKCVNVKTEKITLEKLHQSFKEYADGYGHNFSKKRLSKELKAKKYLIEHGRNGAIVCGIAWKDETPEAVADAPLLAPPVTAAPAPETGEEEAMRKAGLF